MQCWCCSRKWTASTTSPKSAPPVGASSASARAPCALRPTAAEDALRGQPLTDASIEAAAQAAMAACDPAEDLRGSVDYKRAMAGQMLKRAIRDAAARCQ